MPYNNIRVLPLVSGTTYYVNDSVGHDSMTGTNPDQPRKTVANLGAVDGDMIIISTGTYAVGSLTSTSVRIFRGDGKVILNFQGNSLNPNSSYIDLEILNAAYGTNSTGRGTTGCVLRNCTGGNGSISNARGRWWQNCLIKGGNLGTTLDFQSRFIGCLIDGNAIVNFSSGNTFSDGFINNYVATGCTVVIGTISTGTLSAHFRNNCIQGIVKVSGVDYELKKKKDGTAINPNPSIPDLATASGWTDVYTWGNFNEDPKFIDQSNEMYGLQADSPLIKAAIGGSVNIANQFAKEATSFAVTDDGIGGTRVGTSAQIDTTIPDSLKLIISQIEGYADIMGYVGGFTLSQAMLTALLAFDSDATGGTTSNNNVPDSFPLTVNRPTVLTTSGAAANNTTFIVPTGTITDAAIAANNAHVFINGQPRRVTARTASGGNDTCTVNSPFAANIGSGVRVLYADEVTLAGLNPNRLNYLMMTRSLATAPSWPLVTSEWDNGVSAAYGVTGVFMQQEFFSTPVLYELPGNIIVGGGDPRVTTGLSAIPLSPQWVYLRIYLRNDWL